MTKWLAVLAALGLTACQPNDTRVKTVKELLDEGRVLEFTEPGFRHNGCKKKPNALVQVGDDDERVRVVVGKQNAVLAPGIYNCQTVGARVGLGRYNSKTRQVVRQQGDVVVTKISWARVDRVNKSMMKGKYFQSSEQFYNYLDNQKRRLEVMKQNYVTLIEFDYVSGSAVDEKTLVEQENKATEGDGFSETTADGQCIERCPNKPWIDTSVPADFQTALLDKTLGSWFQLGSNNGFKQGAEIVLKTRREDTAGFARARVKKIKRFKVSYLNEKFFVLGGIDFQKIRDHIQAQNATRNEEWMTVTDLEILPAAPANPAAPTDLPKRASAECPSTLTLNREIARSGSVTLNREGARCADTGSVLQVVTVNKDDSVLEIPVRVKQRLDSQDSTTTTLILERLDEQELP